MNDSFVVKFSIGLLSLLIVFHLLIVTGIIPANIVWGSRIESQEQLIVMEIFSIGMNSVLILLVMLQSGRIGSSAGAKWLRIVLWAFALLFALNTIGNLFAPSNIEKSFSLISLVLTYLMVRLARLKV